MHEEIFLEGMRPVYVLDIGIVSLLSSKTSWTAGEKHALNSQQMRALYAAFCCLWYTWGY
jgi:hypothetical protein